MSMKYHLSIRYVCRHSIFVGLPSFLCVFLWKNDSCVPTRMAGLSDSLTIGTLLFLVFGAICFYLYSRLGQTEKRLGLLENLLLTLKMSTEASMLGPDLIEALSNPSPLQASDVDGVEEEEYAHLLKTVSPSASASSAPVKDLSEEAEAEQLLRSMSVDKDSVNVNYESMTLKELRALASERGLPSTLTKKKEIIDALKRGLSGSSSSGPVTLTPTPLIPSTDELEGSEKLEGFEVNLQE